MKIQVKVKPNAKQTKIIKLNDLEFQIAVHAPPHEGKANEALIKALSDYFRKPKTHFRILRGLSGKNKVIEIT